MKALLASALTALVLVTAAWASNVTPAQLTALSKRVSKLEQENAAFSRELAFAQKDNARVGNQEQALSTRLDTAEGTLANDDAYLNKCVGAMEPIGLYTVTFDDGSTGDFWSAPSAADAPDFWVPVTSDKTCLLASSERSRAK